MLNILWIFNSDLTTTGFSSYFINFIRSKFFLKSIEITKNKLQQNKGQNSNINFCLISFNKNYKNSMMQYIIHFITNW